MRDEKKSVLAALMIGVCGAGGAAAAGPTPLDSTAAALLESERPDVSAADEPDFAILTLSGKPVGLYGPEAPPSIEARARIAIAASRPDPVDLGGFIPRGLDRNVEFAGEARFRVGEEGAGVEVTPRLGFARTVLDESACPEWMGFTDVCNNPVVEQERRFLLSTQERSASMWNTFVGVAMEFDSGPALDLSYKRFDSQQAEVIGMDRPNGDAVRDHGVVMSFSVPFQKND